MKYSIEIYNAARTVYTGALADVTPFKYEVLARHYAGLEYDTKVLITKAMDEYPEGMGLNPLLDDLRFQGLLDGLEIVKAMTSEDFKAIFEAEGIRL